jgi:hypothetical protein
MGNLQPTDFNFDIFNNDQVFRGSQIKELFEQITNTAKENNELDEVSTELLTRKMQMLRKGIDVLKNEVEQREKLRDLHLDENGLVEGLAKKLKQGLEFSKDTYKFKKSTEAVQSQIVRLEEMALEEAKKGGVEDKKFAEHLRRVIRDKKVEMGLNDMIYQSMLRTNIFGEKWNAKLVAMNEKHAKSATMVAGVANVIQSISSTLFNAIWSVLKAIFEFLWNRVTDVFNKFLEVQRLTGNLAADLGLSARQTGVLNRNFAAMATSAFMFGGKMEDVVTLMTQFSTITGLNRVFLADQITELMGVAKATGLGVEQTGKMYANMELLGYSTTSFNKYVEETRASAGRLNLNITKILTTVNELLPAFQALNFKNGIDGLTQIVEKAQSVRFDLSNMRNLAVKVFNPEGAIELAAKLRVLGGDFARMADPFNLMLKGQTDAAGLIQDVLNAISNTATKNAQGIFTISPVQQALIREFAEATGESVDNLTRTSLQMAKQKDMLKSLRIGGLSEEERQFVANLAELNAKGTGYQIRLDTGQFVDVANLTKSNITELMSVQKREVDAARSRMDVVEQFKNIYDRFLVSLTPVFQKIYDVFQRSGLMGKIVDSMTTFGNWLANKIDTVLNSDTLDRFFSGVEKTMNGIIGILTDDNQSLIRKIGNLLAEAISFAFKTVGNTVGKAIGGTQLGTAARTTATVMGGLGGMSLGEMIATAIAPLTGGWSLLAIPIMAGIGAYTGNRLSSKILPAGENKADDFIMRGNKVMQFNKGDTVIGGTQLAPKSGEMVAPMVSSRSMMDMPNVKKYDKMQMAQLNAYFGGGSQKTSIEPISLNINGTLQIKGDNNTAYLTSADLKNIGLQQLTYLILNETDRYKNHQSGKRLPSEIISPIR